MNKRSRNIMLLLAEQKQDWTISDLAKKFKVSERTIRNDINDMNDYLKQQKITEIKLGTSGRLIIGKDIGKVKKLEDGSDFYTYRLSKEERKILAAGILVQTKDHITLSRIAEMLYVSRATIINDLDGVKAFLETGHLHVISHSNKGLRLEGSEGNRRLFLLRIMSVGANEIQEDSGIRGFMKGLGMEFKLPEEDRRILQRLINEQEHAYGRFLTDASFDYLMQYLMLSIQRIRQGNLISEPVEGNKSKYKMARDIVKYVSQYWNLEVGEGEADFLCGVLDSMSYIQRKRRDQRIIGLQLVTRKFIENVSRELNLNLNRDFNFYENLVDHLESIFMKSFNVTQRDDFLKKYVEKNPRVLEVVKHHLDMLEKFMGREVSEIEIDYIVIHICAAMERRKKKEVDFQVLIVCGGEVGTSQLLLSKMENRFDFHVVDVVSAHLLGQEQYEDVDLVISTIPLKNFEKDYILVSPVFSDEDYLRVNRKIEEMQEQQRIPKKRASQAAQGRKISEDLIRILKPVIEDEAVMVQAAKKIKEYFGISEPEEEPFLYELLTASNIQLNVECRDWKEAIEKSAHPLLEKGYIEERYIDAMIENVKENGAYIVISPGFALPHEGFDTGCNKVGMNLIRLVEPVIIEDIDGEQESVKIFCCMSTEDHKKHIKAFFHLVNMLTNRQFKEELWQADTPEKAAEIIKTYEMRIKG